MIEISSECSNASIPEVEKLRTESKETSKNYILDLVECAKGSNRSNSIQTTGGVFSQKTTFARGKKAISRPKFSGQRGEDEWTFHQKGRRHIHGNKMQTNENGNEWWSKQEVLKTGILRNELVEELDDPRQIPNEFMEWRHLFNLFFKVLDLQRNKTSYS